ncbi:protein LURP-one-related 10-like [Pistacia vera]|uniref:protein LURP-one-related 10-like n=1 Tax=Pistacia vera TaxID=55513 RepID=UPI0012632942|nr:protein LURP-one-related 10-like [Pistacia vera]
MAHLTSNYPPTGTYPPPPAPAATGIYFPPPPPPAQTGTYPPPPPPLAQTGTYSPHPPPPAPTGIYSPPPPTPAPTGTYSPPPPPHAPTGIYSTPPPTPPLPVANSVTVIGPQFCEHTYPVDLAIVRKLLTITDGNFVVQDINGNTLFKVKGALLTVHNRRVLLDSAGKPIVTLRKKIMTAHDRWQVFRGESKEPSDLIFTAKRSSMFQLKTKLDVFLASNTKEDVCDFKVKGSWSERSCVIHAGDSSAILAQMHMKDTAESILLGKDQFTVTVYPKIDYAFVISLIVILDAINSEGSAADVLSEF